MHFQTRVAIQYRILLAFAVAVEASVPQVSLMTSFTGVTLPPQLTVVPVRYKVDNGPERSMEIPLTCSSTQCMGNVVVVDSVRGAGSKSFTVARSSDSLVAFPLNLMQERKKIAQGRGHTLAVIDGKVWSFGWNRQGELGLGFKDTAFHSKLVKIPTLSGIVSVYAGWEFSVALDSNGNVWTWGSSYQGTLGRGIIDTLETDPSANGWAYNAIFSDPNPSLALIGKKITSIAVGAFHVCAIDSSGNVWVWGRNREGQLGLGYSSGNAEKTPILNPNLHKIRKIAASYDRVRTGSFSAATIALESSGVLFGMGKSEDGRLGNLPHGGYSSPTPININISGFPELGMLMDISATDKGVVLEYQNKNTLERTILGFGIRYGLWFDPVNYLMLDPVYVRQGNIRSASFGSEEMGFLRFTQLDSIGEAAVWWRTATGDAQIRTSNAGGIGANWIAGGVKSGAAMNANFSKVWCWGNDYTCNGVNANSTPSFVAKIVDFDLSARSTAKLKLIDDLSGLVIPFRENSVKLRYSIDDSLIRSDFIPLTCNGNACTGIIRFADHRGVSQLTLNLKKSNDSLSPYPLRLYQDLNKLAQGNSHTLLVKNGEVWSFGWNKDGQLGLGYKDDLFHPLLEKINGLVGVSAVYVGWNFSVALDSFGNVWTWGANYQGSLGNGVYDDQEDPQASRYGWKYNSNFSDPRPRLALSGKKVKTIAVGSFHVVAVDSAGYVWGWGNNQLSALGMGDFGTAWWNYLPITTPTKNPYLNRISKISAATDRYYNQDYTSTTIALDNTGELWGMGKATFGRLATLEGRTVYQPTRLSMDKSRFPNLGKALNVTSADMGSIVQFSTNVDNGSVLLGFGVSNGMWFKSPNITENFMPAFNANLGEYFPAGPEYVYLSPAILNSQIDRNVIRRTPNSDVGVLTESGIPLKAGSITGGLYSGAAIRNIDSSVWCWGSMSVCSGGSLSDLQNARRILFDTFPQTGIQFAEMDSDTLSVGANAKVVFLKYHLGLDSGVVSVDLARMDSLGSIFLTVKTTSGAVRAKRVFVKKIPIDFASIALSPWVVNGFAGRRVIIANKLRGHWYIRLKRIDLPVFAVVDSFDLGNKTADSLVFDFVPMVKNKPAHDGVYSIDVIWSKYGVRDSIIPLAMNSPYRLPPFVMQQVNATRSCIRFPSMERSVVRILRTPYPGGDTGEVIQSALIADSTSTICDLQNVDLRTGAISKGGSYSPLAWGASLEFAVSGNGPFGILQNANEVLSGFSNSSSECLANMTNVDSVFFSYRNPNGGWVVIRDSHVFRRVFLEGKYINGQTRVTRLTAWRGGMRSDRYFVLNDPNNSFGSME